MPGGSPLAPGLGVPDPVVHDRPRSSGPYDQRNDRPVEVRDSVSVFPSASGTVTATVLDPTLFGPGVVGVVISLPVTSQGVSLVTQTISVNAVRGRLGPSLTYSSYGPPFPTSLAKPLDATALGRL